MELKEKINTYACNELINRKGKDLELLFHFNAFLYPDARTLCNLATFLYRHKADKRVGKFRQFFIWLSCSEHKRIDKRVVKLYKRSLRCKKNRIAYLMLGEVCFDNKEYHKAAVYYKKSLDCDKEGRNTPWVRYNLAEIQVIIGDYEDAVCTLLKFLEAPPLEEPEEYETYYTPLFVALYKLGRIEELRYYFKKLIEIYPEVTYLKIKTAYMLKNFDYICEHYQELIPNFYDIDWNLYRWVITALCQKKMFIEAEDFYEAAINNTLQKKRVRKYYLEYLQKIKNNPVYKKIKYFSADTYERVRLDEFYGGEELS
jgi:tetratricopeptide (TPR) repeat protein